MIFFFPLFFLLQELCRELEPAADLRCFALARSRIITTGRGGGRTEREASAVSTGEVAGSIPTFLLRTAQKTCTSHKHLQYVQQFVYVVAIQIPYIHRIQIQYGDFLKYVSRCCICTLITIFVFVQVWPGAKCKNANKKQKSISGGQTSSSS